MKTISRYIMTLALLLTAVTGAWADIAVGDVFKTGSTIDFGTTSVRYKTYSGSSDNSTLGATGKQTLTYQQYTNGKHWFNISTGSGGQSIYIVSDNTAEPWGIKVSGGEGTMGNPYSFEVLFEAPFFDLPLVSQPGAKPQLWEFEMPAFDVVLTPIYAKTAAFATTGTEPDVTTLLPAAAEGAVAGTDAPLIVEGTVAFAGQSTEVRQGTVMYAVTDATATEAPALTSSDWKNTVPTAKTIADDGAEVKVWYYIQGADTPDGVAATLDNTFNNSDVCATPLTVTVLSNKFDLTFKAANANTIDATQASKGTVSVAGTDKTSTLIHSQQDGTDTLKSVKMGSEVKLKAKPGYKFRKVEVKKVMKPVTLKDALVNGATVVITYAWTSDKPYTTTFTFTNDNGSFNGTVTGSDAENFSKNMSQDGTNLRFVADNTVDNKGDVDITFYTESNGYFINSKGEYFRSFTISVDGTDLTSHLVQLK